MGDDRASVVIVGGGVVGTSAAFHLAEAGVSDVLLLEHAELGSGSTVRAAGGFRAQFSDELNIAIALRSIAAFEAFAERPGWDIDLHQDGYLFLLTDEDDVELFQRSVELQHRNGVPTECCRPSRPASARRSSRSTTCWARRYCAAGRPRQPGVGRPGLRVRRAGARRRHPHRRRGDRDRTAAGRVTGVVTDDGVVETDTVVCAAGAWSREVAAMAGVELPVTPVLRPVWFTEPMPDLPPELPMTVDFSTGFYFHPEGPGLLFGMADPDEPPGFDQRMRDDWLERGGRGDRAARSGDAGDGRRRRLDRLLRDQPRPQRADRRAPRRSRGSSTPPASRATASCRARRSARSCATWCWAARRSSTSAPLSASRFGRAETRRERAIV